MLKLRHSLSHETESHFIKDMDDSIFSFSTKDTFITMEVPVGDEEWQASQNNRQDDEENEKRH